MVSDARRAIVTGSSSGIGLAVAQRLLTDGWEVVGFDKAPPKIIDSRFIARRVDLDDAAATEVAARAAIGATALIHAAGVLRVASLGKLRHDDARAMWRLHVEAVMRIADIVVPPMAAARNGRIVLIGSRVADGVAGRSQYAAVKAALVGLARSWAAEVVSMGVTVNVVSPAATQTAMLNDPARNTQSPQLPPIGRLIQPEEVAALVAFLASPAAAAITGQDIRICGGASLTG